MSFITQEDFKVVSSEASLKAITGADPDNISNAIAEAQEEVAGMTPTASLPPKATTATANSSCTPPTLRSTI